MIGFTTLIQGADTGGADQFLIFRKKEVDAGIGLQHQPGDLCGVAPGIGGVAARQRHINMGMHFFSDCGEQESTTRASRQTAQCHLLALFQSEADQMHGDLVLAQSCRQRTDIAAAAVQTIG